MKKEINIYEFREEFKNSSYKNNFTYEQLGLLFDMLEQLEEDANTNYDFDIVAICCDYSGYNSEELVNEYLEYSNFDDVEEFEDDDELNEYKLECVVEYLGNNTFIYHNEDNYIVQAF